MRVKKHIIALLEEKNYKELTSLIMKDRKGLTLLLSLTYDKKDILAWRAMEAIGIAAGIMEKTDRDAVRELANRLLWMLRDESGGIAWSNPEILGEVVRNTPVLCADFAPIIASFHEERMFTPGVFWALARIGRLNDEFYDYAAPIIRSYINDEDARLRGYGAMALGEMNCAEARDDLERLKADNATVDFYQDGELDKRTVGAIAAEALEKISG